MDIRPRLLGSFVLPYHTSHEGTLVGGLSGIDYDPATGEYLLISDDRSNFAPARFYRARIGTGSSGIDSIVFTGLSILKRPDGSPFADSKKNILASADPEALRYNGRKQLIA
ncbi:MAG TPA: esterase-like activity of phytase family protein, partial [Flavisolibacter sp.]|nr:esterase-like activity of phytase family protein [Flavisolibacter sp.]